MNDETKFLEKYFDFYKTSGSSYELLDTKANKKISVIKSKSLEELAFKGFNTLSFSFTKEHLENLISAFNSPDASLNDKYVLACLLQNAETSSKQILPLCQDTGVANVFIWKKGSILFDNTERNEYENLSNGIEKLYKEKKLRFSTTCPQSFYEEKDPKNNMPAQITIFEENSCLAPKPDFIKNSPENSLNIIFCAKGGGSSNKTSFVQGTKAFLNKKKMEEFLTDQISHLGTSACPPYTIAVVVGGLSPEQNLLTLKLATCGAYNNMTYKANSYGFRDKELEETVKNIAKNTGFGAQFGGSEFCLDAIVIRLPRHGASCPLSTGVSCSAHRNLKAIMTNEGYYLEKTEIHPSSLSGFDKCVSILSQNNKDEKIINTNNGIEETLKQLENCKAGDRILLSGKILVARDAAHSRWQNLLDSGKDLPEYTKLYPICYAGPARTPDGYIIGSFGPTTAGRMDSYASSLMSRKAALITLAKGNRSDIWTENCKKYKAFYLGTPGGIAAYISSNFITSQEIIDYEDLGMEAVRLITVNRLPCFIITDNKGNDFYKNLEKKI